MNRSRSLWICIGSILSICLLPVSISNSLRLSTFTALQSIYNKIYFFYHPSSFSIKEYQEKIHQLEAREILLKNKIEFVKDIVLSDSRLQKRIEELRQITPHSAESNNQRAIYLAKLLQQELKSIPGKVIFREPLLWNNFLWIDLGESSNRQIGENIIAKDSPVVVGNKVLGVIEEVHETRSKVRLLTDPSLTISVRVTRGKEQNLSLLESIEELLHQLDVRSELVEGHLTQIALQQLQKSLMQDIGSYQLAKGILQGSNSSLWRLPAHILQGFGFNYEFSDEEGEKIDLRSQNPPIIRIGDLLITTGFDGIFPKGLLTATVVAVEPLNAGDIFYKIRARAAIENIHEIEFVQVLPAISKRFTN